MNNMSRTVRWWFAAGMVGFAQGVAALSASPMTMELQSSGGESRTTLTVQNTSDRPTSVELQTLSLSMDEDGTTSFTPDEESLIVFPPITTIGPGGSQLFQIQYVGDPELAASESFRVSVLQVPVALDESSESSISVATNIHTLVNVAPLGATADLEVVSIEPGDVKDEWIVEVRNDGNRHIRLQETLWQIETASDRLLLSRADIAKYIDGSLVLPKSSRTVRLTSPGGIDLAGSQITIAVPN